MTDLNESEGEVVPLGDGADAVLSDISNVDVDVEFGMEGFGAEVDTLLGDSLSDSDPDFDDENDDEDSEEDGNSVAFEEIDFDSLGIDPSEPTTAGPGTEEKILMLAARYAAGVPLWHAQDRKDQGPGQSFARLNRSA